MSVRGFRLTIVAVACVLIATLAWSAAALAGQEHVFRYTLGPIPTYPGLRLGPETLGVDEASGDLIINDVGSSNILKRSPTGEPVLFSALGSSEISFYAGGKASTVAVDQSSGPNKGNIYVANLAEATLELYGPDGAPLGGLNGSAGEPWVKPCGVAIGPDGAVYVAVGIYIDKFVPKGGTLTDNDYVSSLQMPDPEHCRLAVDSEGAVYAANTLNVSNPLVRVGESVEKYDASQFGSLAPVGTVIDSAVKAVAVDPTNNHVFVQKTVGDGSEIVEYDSSGAEVEAFGLDQLAHGTVAGMAIDGSRGKLYATLNRTIEGNSDGLVAVFSEQRLLMPDVTVGQVSNLSESGARVNASVNPLGLDTKCQVEYGLDKSYGNTVPCTLEDVGSGNAAVAVSADLSGLEAGVQYHYRFVLSNEHGSKQTPDHVLAPVSKPLVDGQSIVSIGISSATLSAGVNPRYHQTSYHFEYGIDEAYGQVSPLPDSPVGAGGSDQKITWTLGGLQPGSVYHVRVVATNQFGTAYGPDQAFVTYTVSGSGSGSCGNAALRQQQNSGYLPNCRAIEMVSPSEKGSANVATEASKDQAALNGNAIKYWSTQAFGDPSGSLAPGAEYVSERDTEGWGTRSIMPPEVTSPSSAYTNSGYAYMSPDLSKGVFYSVVPLLAGHPNVESVPTLYRGLGLSPGGSPGFTLVTDSVSRAPLMEPELSRKIVEFGGASEDLNHIAFNAFYNLTPNTQAFSTTVTKAYEWADGEVRLAGILPNGEPASKSVIGNGAGKNKVLLNPVSADGSRVIFEGPPLQVGNEEVEVSGQLYMRIDGKETVKLNASERSEPQASEPAQFQGATADDSAVFFSSTEALTNDANTGPDVKFYRYDTDAAAGKHLTLISSDHEPADNGDGEGKAVIVGISSDGDYVYFLKTNKLLAGQPSLNGGDSWLYVWHDGQIRTVAQHINGGPDGSWGEFEFNFPPYFQLIVAPDGRHVAFVSGLAATARQAGVNVAGGERVKPEVYRYDYGDDRVVCASCRQDATLSDDGGEIKVEEKSDTGANWTWVSHKNRWMSDDGRYVFFDSNQPLSAQATNGHWNVYEYDSVTAQTHMISPGTCACDAYFVDSTSSGDDAFFTTRQRLVHSDIDTNADMYDARVDGGFVSQNAPPALPCVGESCQVPAEDAPLVSTPASATFSGVGNTVPPPVSKTAVKAKTLTRSQKLAQALKTCRKKQKRLRARCEATARKRYKARGAARPTSRRTGR